MTYQELEDNLIFIDKASRDYEKYSQGRTEEDQENAGFVSGYIAEAHAILQHGLFDSKENFELVTRFLEEHCPNSFNIMIANLDSNPNKYETLYDLCIEVNIRKEDNFEFDTDCLKQVKIYK